MMQLNGKIELTGRWKFRSGWLGRPILMVEERTMCQFDMRRPPTGDNIAPGVRWRDAKCIDVASLDMRIAP